MPEPLRRWLPHPLALPAPAPAHPLALRAVETLLLLARTTPPAVRTDGTLRAAALRLVASRLAPLPPDTVRELLRHVLPWLYRLGVLAIQDGAARDPSADHGRERMVGGRTAPRPPAHLAVR